VIVALALADEFFRLAHHDSTGTPRLHARATDLGLAAALLGELVCERKIYLRDGHLCVWERTPPSDALAHATLDQIIAQPQHTGVRTWLGFLAERAYGDVAGRLVRAGHVRPVAGRRLLRRPVVVAYEPTDLLVAAGPWLSLTSILSRGEAVSLPQGFLLCLAAATGLDVYLLRDLPSAASRHSQRLVAAAPDQIRELTAITAAAVGDAVLAYRT
jgi:hypothetical protein